MTAALSTYNYCFSGNQILCFHWCSLKLVYGCIWTTSVCSNCSTVSLRFCSISRPPWKTFVKLDAQSKMVQLNLLICPCICNPPLPSFNGRRFSGHLHSLESSEQTNQPTNQQKTSKSRNKEILPVLGERKKRVLTAQDSHVQPGIDVGQLILKQQVKAG